MAVKPGYKLTEVGVIPEDWEVSQVGTVAGYTNGKAHEGLINELGKYVVVNSKFVSTSGNVFKFSNQRLSPAFKGEILMVMSDVPNGRAIAKCFFVDRDDYYTINQRICALRPIQIDEKFLFYQINRNQFYLDFDDGVKQTNLRKNDVLSCPLALPTEEEQHAIATALSDVDTLITKLDQLIAKKRDIKQATMQQLLTGQTRLPGFSGKWEVKRLGTTATLKARIGWQGLTTAEYLNTGDYYLVTGTDFKGGYIDWNNCHYVDESRYKQDRYIQLTKYDVLVTKDGTIGKVALVNDLYIPATLNSGVFVIRPIDGAFHPEFFYYLLCSKLFTEFLTQLSAGSTINHLYQKDFVDFRYKTPPTLSEQAAIATILSDMDAEITALESRRDKTRALKQGMMQELLMGRIRLPIAKHHMVSDRTNPAVETRK